MTPTQQLSTGLSLMREGGQEWVVFDERHFGVMEPKCKDDEFMNNTYGSWHKVSSSPRFEFGDKYRRLLPNLTPVQKDFVTAQRKVVDVMQPHPLIEGQPITENQPTKRGDIPEDLSKHDVSLEKVNKMEDLLSVPTPKPEALPLTGAAVGKGAESGADSLFEVFHAAYGPRFCEQSLEETVKIWMHKAFKAGYDEGRKGK